MLICSVITQQMITLVKKALFQEQKGGVDRQFSELLLQLFQVHMCRLSEVLLYVYRAGARVCQGDIHSPLISSFVP